MSGLLDSRYAGIFSASHISVTELINAEAKPLPRASGSVPTNPKYQCGVFGFASPRDSDQRGSQVSLTHEYGHAIMQALRHRGIIGDFRAPDILRFGFTPLYMRYADIRDTVHGLARIMESDEWDREEFRKRTAVT